MTLLLRFSGWEADLRCVALVQLHVETLGPGLQGSLVSEVHVDIGGEQIVHFVTLSGEKEDRNQENEKCRLTCSCRWTHQGSFTQEFLPFNQTSDRHVKISASTGPACNAVEWMSCQHLLHGENVQHIQKKCARTRGNAHVESISFTLVLGWMMVSPCLLIAIKTMSGKCGSDVCWQQIYEDTWENVANYGGEAVTMKISRLPSLQRRRSQTWASGTPPSKRPLWPPRWSYQLVCCRWQQ